MNLLPMHIPEAANFPWGQVTQTAPSRANPDWHLSHVVLLLQTAHPEEQTKILALVKENKSLWRPWQVVPDK